MHKNKPGYKKTKVGWIPTDWECVPLGQVFNKRTAKGKRGIPVFSVTQDRGMVPRSLLERRTGNDVTADKSLLVEPGDIAYNMMRMWQGAVAVCHERCVISPAYVVCRPDVARVDPNFMLAYFKSKEGMHKLCAYSYGITSDRLRLYFEDFSLVAAPLPSLSEQKAITEVLECWDKATRILEQKITIKRQKKKGLAQRLLTGGFRLRGYVTEWRTLRAHELFECVAEKKNGDLALMAVTQDRGVIPRAMLEGRVMSPSGGTDGYKLVRKGDFVISLRSFQGGLEYSDFTGLVSPAYTVLRPKKDLIAKYFSQLFKSHVFVENYLSKAVIGIRDGKQISLPDFKTVNIPFPKLEEQRAIAEILSAADAEIEALERKLALFKKQKRFLLNNLVTGTIRLPQFRRKGGRHD